jgi:hypothetical protein
MRMLLAACLVALPTLAVAQSDVVPQPPGTHRDPTDPIGTQPTATAPRPAGQPSAGPQNGKTPDPFDTKAAQPGRLGKLQAPVSQQ